MGLPINFSAMPDPENSHGSRRVIYVINDSIVSGPNAPGSVSVFHFFTSGWSRIVTKSQEFRFNFLKQKGGNRFKLFLSPAQDNYSVAHLRLRRISAKACSSGMPVSPDAFASSYARMSSKSSSSSRIFSYSSMLMTTAIFSPFSLVRYCVGAFMVLPLAKSSAAEHERQQSTPEDALGFSSLMCA